MTKFLSIKPLVGVLSPLYLPWAAKPFLGWMPKHVRFYLICLLGGFGGWSSEVVGSRLRESISMIVPSLLLFFEIIYKWFTYDGFITHYYAYMVELYKR
jgi:hypothetical protein